jgi:hypothetical protein
MFGQRPEIPVIVWPVALLAALQGWAVVALTPTHPGLVGFNLNTLGTDYMVFYGGVRWLFDGQLGALFDGERFTAYLNTAFAGSLTQPLAFRPWVYPPTYLFVLLPFGVLPFAFSYIAFQLAGAATLTAALRFGIGHSNTRPLVIAAALLGPAAAINAGLGQNAFFVAAALVGGFRLVSARPALGGAILALLTVKPQVWLLVSVALAAAREWRALAWMIAAALALALASVAAFGLASWRNWLAAAEVGYEVTKLGGVWDDSIYACLVSAGAPHAVANAGQAAGTLLGAGLVYYAFRRHLANDRKLAVLLAATVFAAPHSALADTVLLAVAAVLWIADMAPGEGSLAKWTLALGLWLAPLYNPPLVSPVGRLTPVLILGFIAMALARPSGAAIAGARTAAPPASRAAEK